MYTLPVIPDATTQCLYVKDAIVYCVVYQKELFKCKYNKQFSDCVYTDIY